MSPIHARYVRIETIIGTVLNGIVGGAFAWLMFAGRSSVDLWGQDGLAFDLLPTVFMITLISCIALTLLTRARLRAGTVPPMTDLGPRLPWSAPLRAVTMAAGATLLIVPASVLALRAVWGEAWSFAATFGFKIVYSAAVGALVTPPILRAALRDGAAVASRAAKA